MIFFYFEKVFYYSQNYDIFQKRLRNNSTLDVYFILRGNMNNYYIIDNIVCFCPLNNTLENLSGNGESIIINSPASRCFLLLLQQQNKVISQQEFLDEVWQKKGIHVSANTYYQNISILRKGLKKIGLGNNVIITVPRIGLTLAKTIKITVLPPESTQQNIIAERKIATESIHSAVQAVSVEKVRTTRQAGVLQSSSACSPTDQSAAEKNSSPVSQSQNTHQGNTFFQRSWSFIHREIIHKLNAVTFIILLIFFIFSNLNKTELLTTENYSSTPKEQECQRSAAQVNEFNS
ncbi:hypothetical protein EH228_11245 [Erwinia endophytica]|nr:hypothetical protein EH228_11245 [Erwinia endophytica]